MAGIYKPAFFIMEKKRPEQVIITHINADFDALSSMLAAKKLYPDAELVFPGSQEKGIRNFLLHSASYVFNFLRLKEIELENIKKLIIVDTRQKSRIGKFSELVEDPHIEVHIYDHHPDSDDDIRGDLEVIKRVGANTTIMVQILRERGIKITPDEATIMCLGIHEDTGSFTFSSTTPEDYEAAAWLASQGADHNLISSMLTRELTAEQISLLNELIQSAKSYRIDGVDVVICKVIREEYIGDFAVLVHRFMDMENINIIFALAQMEDRIYIVARSRTDTVNTAEVLKRFGGGGHPFASSATVRDVPISQLEDMLLEALREHIQAKGKKAKDIMSSPVITISSDESLVKAEELMNKFSINVLLVMEKGRLIGYITRQTVDKARFFHLEHMKVKEYTTVEFPVVDPDTPIKQVQEIIIKDRVRVLPVLKDEKVLGVITRTDILNLLVEESSGFSLVKEKEYVFQKDMRRLLKERLPERFFNLLQEFGHIADLMGYNAYLVGGFVRDLILRRENLDIDIVIEGDGVRFAKEFSQHFDVKVNVHKRFRTAYIIFPDGFKIDVATARMEYYESPGAVPVVKSSSLKLDLYRRDFTINTLAIKLNKDEFGMLIDYFNGMRDIKDKMIRVLHNLSFVEDPSRVLRAIRFEQRFGFRIGKLTLSLIKNAIKINCFDFINGKRLFHELKLILMEEDPLTSLERMNELKVLQALSPLFRWTKEHKRVFKEIKKAISWYNLLFLEEKLSAWKIYWHGLTFHLDLSKLKELHSRFEMNEKEHEKMIFQREKVDLLITKLKKRPTNYEIYKLLSQYDSETLLYVMAKAKDEGIKKSISNYFTKLKHIKPYIRGEDLIKMGFKPGPIFGKILESVLEAKLNGLVKSREDEIEFVKERFWRFL